MDEDDRLPARITLVGVVDPRPNGKVGDAKSRFLTCMLHGSSQDIARHRLPSYCRPTMTSQAQVAVIPVVIPPQPIPNNRTASVRRRRAPTGAHQLNDPSDLS